MTQLTFGRSAIIFVLGIGSLTLVQCGSATVSTNPTDGGSSAGKGGSGQGGTSSAGTGGAGGTATAGTSGSGGSFGGTGGATDAGTRPGSDAGGYCVENAGDDPCSACLKQHCCSELLGCRADAECIALAVCFTNCADQPCLDDCLTQHPDGQTALEPILTCTQGSCEAECM